MTEHHDLDRQLNAFLLDGPTSLPDSSFDAVRDRTEQTRQRVVLGPWRVPTLNKLVPIGLGAAALVAVLFLGSRFIGSPSSNVGGPASRAAGLGRALRGAGIGGAGIGGAVARISSAADPDLHLAVHGISCPTPRDGPLKRRPSPGRAADVPASSPIRLRRPPVRPDLTEHLFLIIGSQPIGDSTPEEWIAEQMASDEGCTATEPIAVDGATGLIGADAATSRSSQPLAAATGSRSVRPTTIQPPSLPTTGRGSRRSSPPSNSIPRTPSTGAKPIDAGGLDGRPLSGPDRVEQTRPRI